MEAFTKGWTDFGKAVGGGFTDFGKLIVGDDAPERAQLENLDDALQLSSIAIVHCLSPLWSLSTYMAGDWPPAPRINFCDMDLIRDMNNTLELTALHETLRNDPAKATIYITLLAGKLVLLEHQPYQSKPSFEQVLQDCSLIGNTQVEASTQRARPETDAMTQQQLSWEVWRLSPQMGVGTLADLKKQHIKFHIPYNTYRCKLLTLLITASCHYRYYPNAPPLQHVLGLWAKEIGAIQTKEVLVQTVITNCSTVSYLHKWLRFMCSTIQLNVDRCNKQRVLEESHPTFENDDNRHFAPTCPSPVRRIIHVFVREFEMMAWGRKFDEAHVSWVIPNIIEAVENLIATWKEKSHEHRLDLTCLMGWLLGWFRKLHTCAAVAVNLRNLFIAVKPLYTFSRPLGNCADWVLEELRCCVPVQLFPDPSLRAQFAQHTVKHSIGRTTRRNIHMFVNTQSKNMSFMDCTELQTITYSDDDSEVQEPKRPPSHITLDELDDDRDIIGAKANLVLNVVENSNIPDNIKEQIQNKPKQIIAMFFENMYDAMDEMAEEYPDKPDELKTAFDDKLLEMWEHRIKDCNIFDTVKEEEETPPPNDDTAEPEDDRFESAAVEYKYQSLLAINWSPLQRHYAPQAPIQPLCLHPVNHEHVDSFMSGIVDEKTHIPKAGDYLRILQEIVDAELSTDPFDVVEQQQRLDLVVGGGTCTFHRFVTAYVQMCYDHPTFIESDIRIYVLPVGSSNIIAKYLAVTDPWYYTTVYAPLATEPPKEDDSLKPGTPQLTKMDSVGSKNFFNAKLLQKVQDLNHAEKQVKKKGGRPHNFVRVKDVEPRALNFRWCLQNYVSNALFGKPIRVYSVECWSRHNASFGVSVPFCQQVELGLTVALHEFRTRVEKKTEIDGWEEEPVDLESGEEWAWKIPKNFTLLRQPPLKITGGMTLRGQRMEINATAKFDSIVIKNMPKDGDRGPIADPEETHLEMWISEKEETGLMQQKKLRRLADIGEHLRCDFPSPDDKLEIKTADGQTEFRVLIDGDVYGPCTRISIKPLMTPEGAQKVSEWRKEHGQSGLLSPASPMSSSGSMLSLNSFVPPASPMSGSTPTPLAGKGRSLSICSSLSASSNNIVSTQKLPAPNWKVADYQLQLRLMSFCETTSCLM